MPITAFPNGISSYGNPLGLGPTHYAGLWGSTVWFVDGDSGSAAHTGKSPTRAMALHSTAISAASAGDTIYVKPRVPTSDASDPEVYAETITIPYAKNHLSIIGTTNQSYDTFYGPKLKASTVANVVDVYAPRFTLENHTVHRRSTNLANIYLRGITGYATEAGSVSSHIVNCQMRYGSNGTSSGVVMEWGYHSSVRNCTFWGNTTALYITGQSVPQRGMSVIGCRFMPANGTVAAGPDIRLVGASTEVLIDRCVFDDVPSGGSYIQATGVVDGIISDCFFAANTEVVTADAATSEIKVGSGTLSVAGCFHGSTAANQPIVQT